MYITVVVLGALLGLAASAPTAGPDPQAVPNNQDIQIESLNYAGSGCPANSVAPSLSDDRTLLTLAFDKYIAQSGHNIPPTDNRKNCQLTLKLRYPAGFQYSVFTADYRGYASIKANATGTCKTTYYFSGSQQQVNTPLFRAPILTELCWFLHCGPSLKIF
jgi:hypothetical protein